jgi:hypothetical protein
MGVDFDQPFSRAGPDPLKHWSTLCRNSAVGSLTLQMTWQPLLGVQERAVYARATAAILVAHARDDVRFSRSQS